MRIRSATRLGLCLLAGTLAAAVVSKVWVADRGDGTYRNPILYADYSDPDPVRVGSDYYLVSSSFDAVPGLPILHSKDLVNWELIGNALSVQPPADVYSKTQHGNGVWAPSIRYRNGEFYIFSPDPDYGIYVIKAKNAAGPWSTPQLIKAAKGWIDPCPLWDDDGKAYMVSARAKSRAGVNGILVVNGMSPEADRLLDEGTVVFDGHLSDPTLEGPKFYKRNGYYYIFAPSGGVTGGWQLALRSRSPFGPYERRIVLAQGQTPVNGPHQGGWVDTPSGEHWFLHFQDAGAYGRILHLQPMHWVDDWPVMGDSGQPVLTWKKPEVGGRYPVTTPPDSDEFAGGKLGLQWHWQANPRPDWAKVANGNLRLTSVPLAASPQNLWNEPNILLQKFPGPQFTVTAKLAFHPRADGERTGLVVMGESYAFVAVTKRADGVYISQSVRLNAKKDGVEKETAPVEVEGPAVYLRMSVAPGAKCQFSFSQDGAAFRNIGDTFQAVKGTWVGAQAGLFAVADAQAKERGYADYDWFRVE